MAAACAALAVLAGGALALAAESTSKRGSEEQPAGHGGVQLPGPAHAVGRPAPITLIDTHSVARVWNEEMLAAIRRDLPRPTVHARNLFHVSAAMYDAWAAYDDTAQAVLHAESPPREGAIDEARRRAISYAAYRVLSHRFTGSPGHEASQASFDATMQALGYGIEVTTTSGPSAAAVGSRIAAAVIAHGLADGANEQNDYADTTGYVPLNPPLVVELSGTSGLAELNHWQPLLVPGAAAPQVFLTPHWGEVETFALERSATGALYLDPGPPPLLGGAGDAQVRGEVLQVIRYSSHLDPDDGVEIDISPAVIGNNSLGMNDGTGHGDNPVTGEPYPENIVLRADWGRAIAELWADGPLSSTPPGHWNEIANEVSDHPALVKRIGGAGEVVDDLEWDVKLYLALNGAVHDAGIATWEVKAFYDFGRPINLIRGMGERGQSSDTALPSFHPDGLPLSPGLVEVITSASTAPGERHAHLAGHEGEIAILAWLGHPADPETEHGGVGWIRAVDWLPYQQHDFVTPPFAGYTSGHSGFSRASAEVLSAFTGSPYFPGGLGEVVVSTEEGAFRLGFEHGPTEPVVLQWASYADAADEAGISRIFGGIHPSLDDLPGRLMGFEAGVRAFQRALDYFEGAAD